MSDDITMKPLLAVAVTEALRLAIQDSMMPEDKTLADIDLDALAQNLCCRLLGTGGWMVRGVYSGNATPQEILHACVEHPRADPLADVKAAFGFEHETPVLKVVDSDSVDT